MAQSFFPITPVEITLGGTYAWTDADLSAYIPVGATMAIFHLVCPVTGTIAALRKNGSTDDRSTETISGGRHTWAIVGVDANRIVEYLTNSTTTIDIYLIGYTGTGVTSLTNGVNKSPTADSTWRDVDCSAQAPSAIGLIFEHFDADYYSFGVRKNGSTDNRTNGTNGHDTFAVVIGCDANQVCECLLEDISQQLFILGYITAGATFNTNATDISLSTTGEWTDLTALSANSSMGFFDIVASSGAYSFGLRPDGSSEELYYGMLRHTWGVVACDTAAWKIEGKIEDAKVDFYLVGTAELTTANVYKVLVSGTWKTIGSSQVLVSGVWKNVTAAKQLVGGVWKTLF